jgi:hypothetical protein
MLHFTPIQELGQSGSAYSLYHQLQIANSIFTDTLTEEQKDGTFEELLFWACPLSFQYWLCRL